PSRKLTTPVGFPAPGLLTLTVAVNVTGWPYTREVGDAPSVVVVLAAVTVCASGADVLAAKETVPVYTAVIECGVAVTASESVVNVACCWPLTVPRVPGPSNVGPS